MMNTHISLEETLLPALFQCFGIMFLGYILGRFQILGQKEAVGLSKFVQYLALPALIFGSIATMSFENVKWEFIASIFVSKACIFACVVLMTILLTHPSDLGKSGIYAIAATQSNDFALAYPMFLSLYSNSHPDYPSYLYIFAPIQLLVLNTVGFFIIEMHKHKFDDASICPILKIFKGTLKNPIVFMTLVGIIWNFSFGSQIPSIFSSLLKTLSTAFPAAALLLVGHTMTTRNKKTDNHISITVALLIITKNLLLPIVLQKFSAFMMQNRHEDEIQSFSSLGFLYGTTPTAPSAYVFAVQYDVSVDVITKTIIGSTLLSAPLMFASASVISLSQVGTENITFYLRLTIQYLSCASLLCCSWLLFSFFIGKAFKNVSFGVTLYIVFAQFLTSMGGFLLFFSVQDFSVNFYAQYILSIGGIYATRTCTLFLAVLLFVIRWQSLCYILQIKKRINIVSVLCLLVPIIIAALALFSKDIKSEGPGCQLGNIQNIITFVLTLVCFIGTILCLILQHVCFRKKSVDGTTDRNRPTSSYQSCVEGEHLLSKTAEDRHKDLHNLVCNEELSIDVEDLGNEKDFEYVSEGSIPINVEDYMCDSRHNCTIEKRLQCANRINIYTKEEEIGLYDDKQIFQYTTLLIIMSVAMTLSLSVCFWKLVMEKIDGIFIELEFLDTVLTYSFGIVLFIIFGFNKKLIESVSNKWVALTHCIKK